MLNVTSEAFVGNVSPLISSVHGGATLTVDGHGFSSNQSEVQITVGSHPCPVVQASESRVQCLIPPQTGGSTQANIQITSHQVSFPSSSNLTYSSSVTPNVSSVSPSFGSGSPTLQITGDKFVGPGRTEVSVGETPCNVSSLSMTSLSCTVGSSLPAGNHSVRLNVEGLGEGNENVLYRHDLTLTSVTPSEGGYGGGLSTHILGNGFNGTNVSASVCNTSCLSTEVLSNEHLVCQTPSMSMSMSSTNTLCNITVNVDGIRKSSGFTYKSNLTGTISSVSPNRGGTGGGTTLTINGTNFPYVVFVVLSSKERILLFRNSLNAVSVSIGETPCVVQTVTRTSITCQTGAHRHSSVRVPILVSINGSGFAIGPLTFQYIDLWSSQWTWGGDEPPEAGTIVVIENQESIYLDIDTPTLRVLIIDNASLIFEDSQDVSLNVEYIIIVNGGSLQVGSESSPFEHRGVINMFGHLRSIELPICK